MNKLWQKLFFSLIMDIADNGNCLQPKLIERIKILKYLLISTELLIHEKLLNIASSRFEQF